jgi:hypothetical protein
MINEKLSFWPVPSLSRSFKVEIVKKKEAVRWWKWIVGSQELSWMSFKLKI